jgi:hypothetical protein
LPVAERGDERSRREEEEEEEEEEVVASRQDQKAGDHPYLYSPEVAAFWQITWPD